MDRHVSVIVGGCGSEDQTMLQITSVGDLSLSQPGLTALNVVWVHHTGLSVDVSHRMKCGCITQDGGDQIQEQILRCGLLLQ